MKNILTLFIFCLPIFSIGQTTDIVKSEDEQSNEKAVYDWLVDLSEKGIEIIADSVKISKEVIKVLNDEDYRNIIYPKTYTWEQTTGFMQKQELKQAFWFFINLYPESDLNKEVVVKSVLAFDKILKMDELIVNAYYIYSFADPEVSIIKDGKPEITRPDILEEKLRNVKEIVNYIYKYREQQKKEGKIEKAKE